MSGPEERRETSLPGEIVELRDLAAIPDPALLRPPSVAPPLVEAPSQPSPTRAARRARVLASALIGVGWLIAIVFRTGLRNDPNAGEGALQIGLWTAAGLVCLFAVFANRGPLPPALTAIKAAIFTLFGVFFAVASIGLVRRGADAMETGSIGACLALSSVATMGPLVLVGIALRRAFVSAPAWRGAAVGALCGLGGTIAVHAHCPTSMVAHVIVAHGLAVLAGAAVGALFGARVGRV